MELTLKLVQEISALQDWEHQIHNAAWEGKHAVPLYFESRRKANDVKNILKERGFTVSKAAPVLGSPCDDFMILVSWSVKS